MDGAQVSDAGIHQGGPGKGLRYCWSDRLWPPEAQWPVEPDPVHTGV